MFSKQIALTTTALMGSLSAGLAQAQSAHVQWSVTIGSGVGVPVYNPSGAGPCHADARSGACTFR